MLDPIQILFIVVVTTLTVLLVIIGIEVFRILRQAKKTVERINLVLDDVETITSSVAGPVEKISGLMQSMQQGAQFVRFITGLIDSRHKDQPEQD
jgi:uncharacterized protein YoxC